MRAVPDNLGYFPHLLAGLAAWPPRWPSPGRGLV